MKEVEEIDLEVNRIVGLYDFSDQVKIAPLSESENLVYLIDDPQRETKYVARINSGRLKYHNTTSIASELEWLMAIRHETALNVPEVLADKNGDLVHTLDLKNSKHQRYLSVYSFLKGNEPDEDDLVSKFRLLGNLTAQLHQHSKTWKPSKEFSRHEWSSEAILDDAFGWGHWSDASHISAQGFETLQQAEMLLRKNLTDLPKDLENYGMIHADLRLANILVDGDDVSIIDFDDCGDGWYLYELAAAVSFIEEHPEIDAIMNEWLQGYQEVDAISPRMLDAIPSLMMLRCFALLGWIGFQQNKLEFAHNIAEPFAVASIKRAQAYIKGNKPSS